MLKEIDVEVYNSFLKQLNQLNFLGSIEYLEARKKMGWNGKILGCYDEDDNLIATCLLHFKKLPKINYYLYYIPRGMIIDYNNENHLALFTKDIKKYVKEHKGYSLRIDPELPEEINGSINPIVNTFKKLGYKHLGFVNNFEGTQPRCTIINHFDDKSYEEVKKGYEKRCIKHIDNALHNGITIIEGNKDDLDEFMDIMNDTATRGGYITRSREYFEILLDSFKKTIKMYFAYFDPTKINLEDYQNKLADIKKQIGDLENESKDENTSKKRQKKIKSEITTLNQAYDKVDKNYKLVKDIINNYPNGIKLSTALYVEMDNKAWYWFGGSRTIYRELNPVYAMFDQYIQDIIDKNITYFDFLGISGNIQDSSDKNYGLYQFKKSFGGEVTKFVGEFDLVINKPIYIVANKLLTLAQSSKENKVLKKLLQIINK